MEDSTVTGKNLRLDGKIITINEGEIKGYLNTVVKDVVEETLNGMLDAEADELCKASKYERSPGRLSTRAGHYTKTLHAVAGELKLKIPRLRSIPFETAIIERYRRREASVEESLIEMYIASVSVKRVEDITQALWGTRVSPQSERARADRSEALHFRQEPRPCGNHTGLLPRSGMAALHGAFLQKT